MYKCFLLYIAVGACLATKAQAFTPVNEKSAIRFAIKNFGTAVTGHFSGVQGELFFDAADPAKTSFNVAIDASTVNTGNHTRDNHLRKEEFFDTEKFPTISFVSTKITGTKAQGYTVYGKLTMKGTTKPISFPFKATPKDGGMLWEGSLSLDRRDYKIGKSSLVMGDKVEIGIVVFGKKK